MDLHVAIKPDWVMWVLTGLDIVITAYISYLLYRLNKRQTEIQNDSLKLSLFHQYSKAYETYKHAIEFKDAHENYAKSIVENDRSIINSIISKCREHNSSITNIPIDTLFSSSLAKELSEFATAYSKHSDAIVELLEQSLKIPDDEWNKFIDSVKNNQYFHLSLWSKLADYINKQENLKTMVKTDLDMWKTMNSTNILESLKKEVNVYDILKRMC